MYTVVYKYIYGWFCNAFLKMEYEIKFILIMNSMSEKSKMS